MSDSAAPAEGSRFREGAGRLCLDFVRTLRHRGKGEVSEELADPAALSAWVRQCGPCTTPPGTPPTQDEVRDARALREAVHELLTAAMGAPEGGILNPLSAAARARLNQAAALPVPIPRLGPSSTLTWHADEPVPATLALVARDALDLATSPALLPRLRPCASPTCGALFLDHSRPGTRRWCSMDICGNRAKKSALRAR
ncbi:CGNR zinc finger domain-containing protein [Streptomyces sp. NPDC051976]|uniref:CGNR zinc finger domain-containing protein n=1 Tax=Streptomyces sp. NPDC051976 TaxID=3154947 RepID=UPI00343F2195